MALLHTSRRRSERIRKRRERYFLNLHALEELVEQLDKATTSDHSELCRHVEILSFLRPLRLTCGTLRFWSLVELFRRRFPCLKGRTFLDIDWIVYRTADVSQTRLSGDSEQW